MKIMIDTNIIISAALFPNGKVAQAFFKALFPPYRPLVCNYVVDELHRKFRGYIPEYAIKEATRATFFSL